MFSVRATLLRSLFLGSITLLLASPAAAHTVETVDGEVYEGKVIRDDDEVVVIMTTFDGRKSIPRRQVKTVDTSVIPLRDQLEYRAGRAKDDVKALWVLHRWAKEKGFEKDLEYILQRIIELEPKNVRARKLLGHEKVDGTWMTPDEKEIYLREQHQAEMRAQGLVEHEGRWITPEQKDAIERGLLQDGDEWVTEEEYHRRRGEQLIDGEWTRIGEKEGKAWRDEMATGRVKAKYLWGANFDIYYDTSDDIAKRVLESAEAAFKVMRATLLPTPKEYPVGLPGRVRLHVFSKLPAYARLAKWFDGKENCDELVPGWARAVQKQHAFWWVQPIGVVGAYKFPNTTRTVVSNTIHHMGMILLTQYNFNYRFPSQWLLEGFAYYLEMEAMGYTDTFSISRAGTAAADASGKPVWIDSAKWRGAIRSLVAEGRDPPLKRIARMTADQMGYKELAKSWSVVEYLIRLDRAKFKAFIDTDKDRAKTTEDALKEVYGLTWRELDRKWRAFVSAGYLLPGELPPEPEEGKD